VTDRPRRVLVHRPGALGDTVVAIPALRAIRRHFGGASTICLLHERVPGIVSPREVLAVTGLVDGYASYPSGADVVTRTVAAVRLWRTLRRERFDCVVNLVASARSEGSVAREAAFFRSIGIPQRIGFRSFRAVPRFTPSAGRTVDGEHEAVTLLRRLADDGLALAGDETDIPLIEPPPAELEGARQWLAARRSLPDRPLVVICPGTRQPAKAWPVERFAEIGHRLVSARYEPLVVGGEAERHITATLVDGWGAGIAAAGEGSVLRSAALMRHAAFAVGLDTGAIHVAAAVGLRCIAIFSNKDHPGRWSPLGDGHRIVRSSTPCGPCLRTVCGVPGHPCMNDISVDMAWREIVQVASTHTTTPQ
jgi:heptosyltransferase III